LELQRTCVDDNEHKTAIALKKDFVHSRIADAYYHPGVTEAVAVEFGEVSSWEGVWATRKQGSQWARVELDVRAAEIPQHIKDAAQAPEASEVGQAELVDATEGFNLVKSEGRFLAVAKQLGPSKLFTERLGERELAPLLFTGESLEEVREKAMAWEASSAQPAPDVLGDTASYNLLRVGEKFLAVAKSLGPTDVLVERLGQRELSPVLLIADTLEEVRDKAVALELESERHVVELVEATQGFNLVKSEGRFLAVAKQLGPSKLFTERLGERELAPLLFVGESLEDVREKAMAWEASSAQPAPDVLGDTASYNLLRVGEKFLAVAKSLGPTDVLVERLGQRELSPVLLIGDALEEVREKAHAIERHTIEFEVALLDEIGQYNIVQAGERFIAVAKELGAVNLFRERVGERDLPPLVLVAPDLPALRQKIAKFITKTSRYQDR
jgi:hypothetical protein